MGLEPSGSWNTGDPNPGTGGNRDTYNPSHGSVASQAQHTEDLERVAALAGRKGLSGVIARFLVALRRIVWGA
jgi:hypothetical protein